jgi:hypothetical protein
MGSGIGIMNRTRILLMPTSSLARDISFSGVRTHLRAIGLALLAAGSCVAEGASAACVGLAGTADGFNKKTAVSRAQSALDDFIEQYKAENHLDAVTISAMRAEPQPYWRGRVSENMMYRPDIVTAESYTTCWQGVVSTYVCTSGAQVCW